MSRRSFIATTGAAAGALWAPGLAASAPGAANALASPGPASPAVRGTPSWDTMSDTWPAVDGLGRRLPGPEEAGPPRPGRFVGMFYFLWLGEHSTTGPWDITKILDAHPEARDDKDHPAWGPLEHFHHWGEPHLGYYRSDDRYVIRRHATMLADAGVDVVIFDVTNGFTYPGPYTALFETFAEVRAMGEATPAVAFLTPFGNSQEVVSRLYDDVYAAGFHEDLWFRWDGKPLILANPDSLGATLLTGVGSDPAQLLAGATAGQSFVAAEPLAAVGGRVPTWTTTDAAMTWTLRVDGPGGAVVAQQRFENVGDNAILMLDLPAPAPAGRYYLEQTEPAGTIGWWTEPGDVYAGGQAFAGGLPRGGDRSLYVEYASSRSREIRDFFTFRSAQPSYFVGPTRPDQWSWLEVAPQHVFRDADGNAEEMCVGVGQNAVDGRLGAMSEPRAHGRSYHDGTVPPDTSRTAEGLNFQEQWDNALAADPEFVFVTGWNEWVAMRFDTWGEAEGEVIFVDQFDWEHSRDIEPMVGGHGDAYYYQLVANIRRYKGVRPAPPVSPPTTIHVDGRFDDWRDVGPEFRGHRGDTAHRDHPGWGTAGPYVNTSGRNDIEAAKVARDRENVYFYVRTAATLTPHTDPHWMQLLIDTDGDPATGWEGFDVIVNRRARNREVTTVERCRSRGRSTMLGSARLAVQDRELEIAVPRSMLGLGPDDPVRLEFKWVDNVPVAPGEILDLIDTGDAAPGGRFRFRYHA